MCYHENMKRAARLPAFFKPLLWSYDFSRVDPIRERRAILVNAINYGDLTHWRWLVAFYGKDAVREELVRLRPVELRPQARRLASLVFDLFASDHAPRSS